MFDDNIEQKVQDLKNYLDHSSVELGISGANRIFNNFIFNNSYDMNADILNILMQLDGNFRSRNIQYYDKDITLDLNYKDILFISNSLKNKYFTKIYTIKCYSGNIRYFGLSDDKMYLFGKNKYSDKQIVAIKIFDRKNDNYSKSAFYNLLTDKPSGNLKITVIDISSTYNKFDRDLLTEGFNIDKDGSVKFSFSKKTRYMDLYDKTHKQIIVNWDNKNVEGLKQNLAFLFSIIIDIERKYIHDKQSKADETIKADAIKARMFAMNDFKTYMKKLKTLDPNFDFTKYYESKEYDKITFTISPDNILGVKKLFQLIMMG
jgi:hypothetical protein